MQHADGEATSLFKNMRSLFFFFALHKRKGKSKAHGDLGHSPHGPPAGGFVRSAGGRPGRLLSVHSRSANSRDC